jgi:hypothetical protein
MNTKTDPLTKAHNSYPWNSNRLLEDLTTNYKDIVNEEFQHIFNFNFGVRVGGIRVVFNKVMLLMTGR